MPDALREKVRAGLIWSAIQSWAVRLSGLVLFVVLARLLAPSEIGLFAAANVVILLLNLLADQGLSEAVVQRQEVSERQLCAVFWINISVAIVVAIIAALAAPYIAQWMGIPQLSDILRVAVFAVPMTALAFGQLSLARRQFDYRRIAIISLASTTISGVVALGLAFMGAGVWSLVVQAFASSTITAILFWIRPRWHLTLDADFRSIYPFMTYGLNRLATHLLDFVSTRYIDIFLATTLGPVALGIYSVGVRIHQALMQSLSAAILDVAHNAFSRLASDRPKLINAYYDSVSLTAAVAVPIFALVGGTAPLLASVLFGEKWADSANVMSWMAVLGAIQVVQYFNGTIYNAIGRPSIGLLLMPIKVMLIVAGLHFSSGMGLSAVVAAFVISQLPMTPLSFMLVRRLVGVSIGHLLKRIWPFLVGSILLALVSLFIEKWLSGIQIASIWKLALSVSGGTASYLLLLLIFARAHLRSTVSLLKQRRH